MASIVQWCLDNLNYWTITFFMFLESSIIPFPSEIVIPPAAYRASVTGELNIFFVIFFGTLGANLGALANYYLAKILGRSLIYKFANSKIGHLLFLSEEKIAKSEAYFYKNGGISTLIGRLIPGVRSLISLPAGIVNMKLPKFLLYTTLGSMAWNIILALIGYYCSKIPTIKTEQQLLAKIHEYNNHIIVVILIFIIIFVSYIIFRKHIKNKKINE